MVTSDRKSSKQNQSNLDESQRDTVKRKPKEFNPQINLKRLIDKNSLRNGLIIRRKLL